MESGIQKSKTRLIVLTDISSLEGGFKEPDDTQSLVRLMLYSNEFEIEGLIATYTKHWQGEIKPEYIETIVKAYGKVRENLIIHDPRYPPAEQLLNVIKSGNVKCGLDQVGPGKDTEGSDWIISVVDKPDPRPVWITIWGGPTDLAQALWRVTSERSPQEARKFKSKIRVYSVLDQYDETGPWIRENHPDIFYITSHAAVRGIYMLGDSQLVSREWVLDKICNHHGALGAVYPVYNGGAAYAWHTGRIYGIKEGDTPSFLYLVQNGLSDPMEPSWGSWGGRFNSSENHPGTQFFDAIDAYGDDANEWLTVSRWRAAFQADFEARMDWCVKPYEGANHPPVVVADDPPEKSFKPLEVITLSAEGSYDPDGDHLSYYWFYYPEPSSFKGLVLFKGQRSPVVSIMVPKVTNAGTLHIILAVTDDGSPALTRYKRFILKVCPE